LVGFGGLPVVNSYQWVVVFLPKTAGNPWLLPRWFCS
jgi:hypothetical protein